jgi:hypothetical protein
MQQSAIIQELCFLVRAIFYSRDFSQ